MNLVCVVQLEKFKVEFCIFEIQVKDVMVGQCVLIDMCNGIIEGRVVCIDLVVCNGSVMVDVMFIGELFCGVCFDFSVDGMVEFECFVDVFYVNCLVYGQVNSCIGFFKLDVEGDVVCCVQVQLGCSLVIMIEIVEGLWEGDEVVFFDMLQYDEYD